MSSKFKSLKNQLESLEDPKFGKANIRRRGSSEAKKSGSGWFRYLLFSLFVISFLLYAGARYNVTNVNVLNPFDNLVTWVNQPDEELLQRMGDWMEEMGYTGLTREELIELRQEGVTATFTSRMRDLGYTDLTLDDLVRLRQNDVSATFSAMMKELGYELTIEDLIQLRQHGVTAFYTSNLHDLGYKEITKEELIRLKDTGVRTSEVEHLIEEQGSPPEIEELIRYHTSNQ